MDHSFKDSNCFIEDDIGGKVHPLANKDLIYINSSEPEWRMTLLVAHECKHLADHRAGLRPYSPGARKDMENRATTFALDIVLELGEKRLS
jgi:Zn-dependent peptidase ImmA (M78 family)